MASQAGNPWAPRYWPHAERAHPLVLPGSRWGELGRPAKLLLRPQGTPDIDN